MKSFLPLLIWLCVCCCSQKDKGITTVYTTNTGKKYHSSSCRYLAKSSIPVSLQDAISSGYKPCGECNPPVYSLPENDQAQNKISDSVNLNDQDHKTITGQTEARPTIRTVKTRCTGITKKGKQCKHMTDNLSGLCLQHELKK
jgi:hypothetical protein